jgi:hypothetical protein
MHDDSIIIWIVDQKIFYGNAKKSELAYNEDSVIELYDLVNDPGEQNNLAKKMRNVMSSVDTT